MVKWWLASTVGLVIGVSIYRWYGDDLLPVVSYLFTFLIVFVGTPAVAIPGGHIAWKILTRKGIPKSACDT